MINDHEKQALKAEGAFDVMNASFEALLSTYISLFGIERMRSYVREMADGDQWWRNMANMIDFAKGLTHDNESTPKF